MLLKVILAATPAGGIGYQNTLPWPLLKSDMARFKKLTMDAPEGKRNAVLMGKNTWFSIPEKHRPLVGRLNCVISTKVTEIPGCLVFKTPKEALEHLAGMEDVQDVFVIGGAALYNEALHDHVCDTLYLTRILDDIPCDVFVDNGLLPPVDFSLHNTPELIEENDVKYQFEVWQNNYSK